MRARFSDEAFRAFIAEVRAGIDPADRDHFDVFAGEARFGLSLIEADLASLPARARILEVGAGVLLLSGILAERGFDAAAVEPVAPGFGRFSRIQRHVLRRYERMGLHVDLLPIEIESLDAVERFDYAFSINVFEHIRDVELGLANTYRSLKPGATMRIYCPNYHFPYEPHFNIPTLVDKQLTERMFGHAIFASKRVDEPAITWEGLNWISVSRVRRFFSRNLPAPLSFNREATYAIFLRALTDADFAARRSRWMGAVLRTLHRIGLLRVFRFVPPVVAPVMDFTVRRCAGSGSPRA